MQKGQQLKDWIGKKESRIDVATAWPVAALAATLDRRDPEPVPGVAIPPGWHWLLLLLDLCRRHDARPVRKLDYRAMHPVFHTERMTVNGNPSADGSKAELWTANGAGKVAMTATAYFNAS